MENFPYLVFDRHQWCKFRDNEPLTLTEADVEKLHGQIETASLTEIEAIYLPLSRLLSAFVRARQKLYNEARDFLANPEPKVPYIIGVAGSVAVGKSLTSRILQALLSRWPNHPNVALITTDGFLYSNQELKDLGLMNRKGFPESYNIEKLLQTLAAIKAGVENVAIPLYSHENYDRLEGEYFYLQKPDIVIIEGLNILQTGMLRPGKMPQFFVSDYLDFSIFVDAKVEYIREWYLQRFMKFRDKARKKVEDFYYQFTQLTHEEALKFAERVWREINEINLCENILPFRERARLVLCKGADHAVSQVWLRKL